MRQRLIALVLLLAVTPFASELVEWGVHAVTHGDFAHGGDPSHEEGPDEHGCTPLLHNCGCHKGGTATEVRECLVLAQRTVIATSGLPEPDAARNRLAEPPPLRPPIA